MALRTRLVPRRAGWMPWQYDMPAARFLSRVRFPVLGLAVPPPDARMVLGGRGEGGGYALGTRFRSAPCAVELVYDCESWLISVQTQVHAMPVRMGGVARPDAGDDEELDIRVDGRPMVLTGWSTRHRWQGEATIDGLLVTVAVEPPTVASLDLVTMHDLRPACRAGDTALRVMPPAYGTVSDPERYRALHVAARSRASELVDSYDVECSEGVDTEPGPWQGAPVTHLVPRGGGAPVSFVFTPFPALEVRYGHNGRSSFPACGCDACDEDPAEEIDRMLALVADIVAGGLTEQFEPRILRNGVYKEQLEHVAGGLTTRTSTLEGSRDSRRPKGRVDWAPWTPVADTGPRGSSR